MGPFVSALTQEARRAGGAVVAVLNVTPDSFFDGGRYETPEALEQRLAAIVQEGARFVDIGAESTRPGAAPVSVQEQCLRLEPAVRMALARGGLWVSVDTTEPDVADRALSWGAHAINDVSCLANPELARVVATRRAALLLMHARGSMSAMPGFSEYPDDGYSDVVADVSREWSCARDRACSLGLERDDVVFDPGLGFAKNAQQSWALVRALSALSELAPASLLGPSRKSFLNLLGEVPPALRLGATIGVCIAARQAGVTALRVHDVQVVKQALAAWRLGRADASENGDDAATSVLRASRDCGASSIAEAPCWRA